MSSGGSAVSFMKSHKRVEDHSNAEISEGKVIESNVRKSEIKAESFTHPLAHKSPNIESSNQLHHYARSLVMVQR